MRLLLHHYRLRDAERAAADQPQAAWRRRHGDEERQAVGAALLRLLHSAPRHGALLLLKVRQLEPRAVDGGGRRGFNPTPSLNSTRPSNS